MLLVFDIGNSNIVMGAYDGKKLYRHWRISTDRQKTGDEYGMLINELFRFQGMDMNDIRLFFLYQFLHFPVVSEAPEHAEGGYYFSDCILCVEFIIRNCVP
ncbi:type III pantothenate kinase, partial [Megamonas funiformis]|uniref:type III pantothenate kinase n=1 Tax=Megamonas funiformis TaxID=437897 RepID=UPI00242DF854